MKLRLGTRSSRLALWQAHTVASVLRGRGVECKIVSIETKGDEITDRPLPEIGGDGAFTERIERSLSVSAIDIAVHSLKDLPVEDPDELCVGAVLGREEVREVLITRGGKRLADLPAGAVVGSSSTRRQAQLLALRPDLVVRPIRGNVETRIRKVESGEYDATLLAGIGVLRLGLAEKISQWIEIDDILPAPGQGAVAIQCRTADESTRRLLAAVDDPVLRAETGAERGFLRALGGGCSAPVGAFARARGGRLWMRGRVSALDGSRVVEVEDEGEDPAALVAALAGRALSHGAADLIIAAGRLVPPVAALGGPRAPGGLRALDGLSVVVTRAREQADELCRRLRAAGAAPVVIPMIRFSPLSDTSELDEAITNLESYRWLIFASANGVEYFMKRLTAVRRLEWPRGSPRVAAVGPGTAAALGRHGINVDFIPPDHTAAALAEGLIRRETDGCAGAKVLMPRALEGREDAAALLRQQGARVDDIPAYRTEPCTPSAQDLSPLDEGVDAILFSSSSAVNAWCDLANGGGPMGEAARRAVIACIGPTTAATARERGLRVDVEAPSHNVEGLVEALERHFSPARGGTT